MDEVERYAKGSTEDQVPATLSNQVVLNGSGS